MALCPAWHSCTVSGNDFGFLIFSNLSSKPTETVQEVSAVNGTGIVLPSHFTERKITDPSTARDAINDVADTLGIVSVEDELGTADCSTVLGDTYYSFPQVYRGIPVYGRKVTVSADADSEAALLTSGFYPIENLSVEAKITQNDAGKNSCRVISGRSGYLCKQFGDIFTGQNKS